MSIAAILTTRAVIGVMSLKELQDKHQVELAKKRARGLPVVEHRVTAPQMALVNHGRWIIHCPCGSGVAVDVDLPEARCFGCGAIYTSVTFPPDRVAIEAELVKRDRFDARNWLPGESVDDLRADRVVHQGVR